MKAQVVCARVCVCMGCGIYNGLIWLGAEILQRSEVDFAMFSLRMQMKNDKKGVGRCDNTQRRGS